VYTRNSELKTQNSAKPLTQHPELTTSSHEEAYRNRCASGFGSGLQGILCDCLENWQVFTMSKGNTKAQEVISTLSAESILITGESNWIQTLLRVKRRS
jgi:hypothetical protein